MQPLPVTIHRHWIGYLAIAGVGLGALAIVLIGLSAMAADAVVDPQLLLFLTLALVISITTATIVQLWVYAMSYISFTPDGIIAVYWKTLFVKQTVRAEWVRVQDVSAVRAGIFSQVLGYGTLNIQTAGTRQETRLTMVPNVEYWKRVVFAYADIATQDGMDLSTMSDNVQE